MAKSLPPLTWFRAFEAAARNLSFTAASVEIGMTQSAVSQHVKSLESRLGVALFIRKPRGLSLTDDGRKLVPQVASALETLAAASRLFETGPTENLLTIATSVSVAEWVIAPRLTEFTNRHPNTRLRFVSTIWPDDFHMIYADIEIPFGTHKQFGKNSILLEPNGLVALKSPSLHGALHTLPLIESVGTSAGWSGWPGADAHALQPHIFVDSFDAALNMACHGNGVALVSEVLARSALASGQLVRAHDDALPSAEGYYLRTDETNNAATNFRDWLLETER
ncbi:LysR family transcriptional regulator [uncultured Sulfitobacter sp.]|uniref:LysR family transcriptional regulator n=1 Tax=uncultured Sulfitobacter sp. TaxID=191468 RepID=UPI00262C4077|nr:LysR family transcriptional regulator [uncultured Sulfitobacter sp.]